jgi:hypothetical protein
MPSTLGRMPTSTTMLGERLMGRDGQRSCRQNPPKGLKQDRTVRSGVFHVLTPHPTERTRVPLNMILSYSTP